MLWGAYLGNGAHVPANTRLAVLSAYAGGATLLSLAVRPSADGHLILARADDLEATTGQPGKVSELSLADLNKRNFAAGFVLRGTQAGDYHYLDPAVEGRRLPLDTMADTLAGLPRDAELLIEVRGATGVGTQAAELVASRGFASRTILACESASEAAAAKRAAPAIRTALLALDGNQPDGAADLLVRVAGFEGDPSWQTDDRFPLGQIVVVADDLPNAAEAAQAAREAGAYGFLCRSTFDLAPLRLAYVHAKSDFAGEKLDRAHFSLGYAKANRFATVSCNDGVHIDIAPYDGPMPRYHGDAIERRLGRAEWDIIDIGRTWPFYSGGGFGLTLGLPEDFAVEVTYRVENVGQATTLEMAVTNVDPGSHRGEPPKSFRDKDSFYDPHGAPPYVGVEHDEDDGYRINWNLGSEYDNNQYGRPVGDGRTPRGARLRLERRGAYFAAYYRDAVAAGGAPLQPRDWVCVGAVRNDSLNREVFVRCVAKRWRQEKADDPSQYEPILPNRFTFTDFEATCFPPDGDL